MLYDFVSFDLVPLGKRYKAIFKLFVRSSSRVVHSNNNASEIVVLTASDSVRLRGFFVELLYKTKATEINGLRRGNSLNIGIYIVLKDILWALSNRTDISLCHKLMCISDFRYYLLLYSKIDFKRAQTLICDFDRYPTNAPLVYLFKTSGKRTITLLHGTIIPIDQYLPLYCDEIWVWGDLQKRMFQEYVDPGRVRIVGNPKINPLYMDVNVDYDFAFAFSKLKECDEHQIKMFDIIDELSKDYKILVSFHPLDCNTVHLTNKKFDIVQSDTPSWKALQRASFLVFGDSQVGTDMLAYNRPLAIVGSDLNVSLRNGFLLVHYCGIPFASSAFELLKLYKSSPAVSVNKNAYSQLISRAGSECTEYMISLL